MSPTFVRSKAPSKKPNTQKPTRRSRPTAEPTLRPTATKFVGDTAGESAAPSPPPQTSISASLNILQTLSGLSPLQTADDSFVAAVTDTVVALLGDDITVTGVTLSKHGRRLLANMNLMYTVTATNGMTAQDIIDALQDAMDSGDFLALLSAVAGVLMNDVSNLEAVDISPTSAPIRSIKSGTHSLTSKRLESGYFLLLFFHSYHSFPPHLSEEYTTISGPAIAGGCIGGVLIALAVSFYLYKAKNDKTKPPTIHMHSEKDGGDFIPYMADTMNEKPKSPTTQMYNENDGGDFIPYMAETFPESCQAKEDQKCEFTIIYPTSS